MLRNWALALGGVAFSLLLGEGIVRGLGRSAERPELSLRVTPTDARLYTPDAELGYTVTPNVDMQIEFLKKSQSIEFSVRTDDRGRRWTGIQAGDGIVPKPEVWIFGCSFTFGWLVDDDESYPWLLQQRFPSLAVRNYGVGGYGTLQSLLQYQRALRESDPPRIAILAYANFHEERNVMSPLRSKRLGRSWRAWGEVNQPYMQWLGEGKFVIRQSSTYQPYLPFVESSALANRLDRAIFKMLERRALLEDHRQDVSRHLVDEFERESRSHGVVFALGQLDSPLKMVEYAQRRGIPVVDMALPEGADFEIADDGHPNPRGHRFLAERAAVLIENLTGVDHDLLGSPSHGGRAKDDRHVARRLDPTPRRASLRAP
jgi:hypothetical protein